MIIDDARTNHRWQWAAVLAFFALTFSGAAGADQCRVLTQTRGQKSPPLLREGRTLFWAERKPDSGRALMELPVTGGSPAEVPVGLGAGGWPAINDVYIQGKSFFGWIGSDPISSGKDAPLYFLMRKGKPVRWGKIDAHAAAWSPNGSQVAYLKGNELALLDSKGARTIWSAGPGATVAGVRWSPDGTRLRAYRVTLPDGGASLWEIPATGGPARNLFSNWGIFPLGTWLPDGRYVAFASAPGDRFRLWLFSDEHTAPRRIDLICEGSEWEVHSPVASADSKTIYGIGLSRAGRLEKYDAKTRRFTPVAGGPSADMVDRSRDRKSIAYIEFPGGALKVSRADGTGAKALTRPEQQALAPRWSPDGSQIAFTMADSGGRSRVYLIHPDGTGLHPVPAAAGESMSDPTWSRDGTRLIVGSENHAGRNLKILDARTGAAATLPGSDGLWSPRWSYDGRWIAALNKGSDLMVYDLVKRSGSILTRGPVGWPSWTSDSKSVRYLRNVGEKVFADQTQLDGKPGNGRLELTSLGLNLMGKWGAWVGLDSDDSPLVLDRVQKQEIIAIDLTK